MTDRSPSEVHEDEQLHVDAEAFGALLLDEIGNVLARDEMDVDVLVLVPAALADPPHPMRTHQGEALRQHSRGGIEVAEPLDALGGEAGLFLELLYRGCFDSSIPVLIPNEAGGKLDAA